MASADYSVGTKVTADVSNFERGMNKAEKSLKGFSEKLANSIDRLGKKGLVGSVANVTLAMQGLTKSFNTVIKFAKDVGKAINECTEAYKGQVIAERALDTAIQNNPFVTGESSKALKQFASDMQRVSNYGDEELIPMMANLISLGRTESETMQIMSVAMDMSAGMGISLDSAITQLNATLNGNIGRLGQQNAELKNLTEEELKQGKAIEILGEKFKGLSGATADTSKQLQNIKGDFKEALGQFTLPSSDMWNKFWSGFYEKGIAVLKKIDEWMDTSIIGEKMAENIEAQLKKVKGDKNKTGYAREAVSVITERELELLIKYLEGQKKLNANEKVMLKVARERAKSIEYMNNVEKQYLEDLAEEKRLKEEAEAREKELAELRKKQEEEEAERQKQLAIQKEKEQKMLSDWQGKLFSIRIENLERQRELELENEELTEEQKEQISKFYGEQILAMRLQQIEKNREEALNAENVTEESRLAINLYYDNEITKAKQEEEKKRKKAKKEGLEEEEKEEKKTLSAIIKIAQEATKKIGDSFKKVADTVKNVFSKIKSIFKGALNVFKFNPDDALNSLLAIEDAILTFFVETLPKLPQFFASAIQSIVTLLETLVNSINWEDVEKILFSIIDSLVENLPKIVNTLLDLIINLMQTLLDGFVHFVENGGWKTLLDCLLTIQKRLEQFVVDNIDTLVQTIIDMLPDLVQFLIDSIVSASKTISKLIKPIIRLVLALIEALFDVLTSDEVIDAGIDAGMAFIDAVFDELLPGIIKLLPKLLLKIVSAIIKNFPKIVTSMVDGLVKAFTSTDWNKMTNAIFTGFVDAIKDFFGIHSPSTLFESFGEFMIEGLINGITGMIDSLGTIFAGLAQGITNIFNDLTSSITNIFNNLTSNTAGGLNNFAKNVMSVFNNLSDNTTSVFNNLTSNITGAFNNLTNNLTSVFNKISDVATSIFNNMTSSITSIFNGLTSSVTSIVNGLGSAITSVFNNTISNITSLLNNLLSQATNLINTISNISLPGISLGGGSGGSSGGSDKVSTGSDLGDFAVDVLVPGGRDVVTRVKDAVDEVSDWVDSWKWWATGSNAVPSGVAVVGEAGPELVKFRGGEQVLNAHNTQKALEGMGGTTINQNVTFNNLQDTSAFAMIQQLKQYNRQMAINGII